MKAKIKKIVRLFQKEGLSRSLIILKQKILNGNAVSPAILNFNFSTKQLKENFRVNESYIKAQGVDIKSINWFIPYSQSFPMGGRLSIYRFASFFAEKKNVVNNFIICGNPAVNSKTILKHLQMYVPTVQEENIYIGTNSELSISNIPYADAAIATRWDTAYPLLKFNRTKAKFYFVQDFEPLFYPAGVEYALAEATYRFGFYGIVSTPGLCDVYKNYTPYAVSFHPSFDRKIFHPSPSNSEETPLRLMFYGRPSFARNGFSLGIESLKIIKELYRDKVEILSAGEEWSEHNFGVKNVVKNVGLVGNLDELGALYRQCQIGLAFCFSNHTSFQPIDYMASGMAVVTNKNLHTAWLLESEKNCLQSEPVVDSVVDALKKLIDDRNFRDNIAEAGFQKVNSYTWEEEINRVWDHITKKH